MDFFSLAGAGFEVSDFIYTFPVMAIFFLLPTILIERKKNPVWVKRRDESKIKKLEAETIANQQRKEEAIRLQQLKEENERLKQEADSEVAKVDQDTTNYLTFKRNDGGAVDSPQELPVVTVPSEESNPAIKEDPPSKNTKEKAPLSHRIGGVILIVLSSFLCLLIVPVFVLGEKKLIFPSMFGLGALMFGISLCCGKFMKFEQSKKCKGVYLTQDQIKRLEEKIELPILDTPVFLNYGEVAVYHSQATRQETKNRVIGRMGSYGGGTIRIAKGLSIHTGGSSSRPIYGDVSMQYPGEFIITNERVIFLSSQKGFELKH